MFSRVKMTSSIDSQQCEIARLNANEFNFSDVLDSLIAWDSVSNATVKSVVREIIGKICSESDSALLEYTNRFDRSTCTNVGELCIAPDEML
jgi:histidinol dehydrogenase